jgi:hypothetical protein
MSTEAQFIIPDWRDKVDWHRDVVPACQTTYRLGGQV